MQLLRLLHLAFCACVCLPFFTLNAQSQSLPKPKDVLKAMNTANNYFIDLHPDAGEPTFVHGKQRPSNLWTRGVYFEGLMALQLIDPQDRNADYLNEWAWAHAFTPRNGVTTRDADDYCCSQTFLDLYVDSLIDYNLTEMLTPTKQCFNNLLVCERNWNDKNIPERYRHSSHYDWTWIDAIQMGLPALAKLSRVLYFDGQANAVRYNQLGWRMYQWTRDSLAGGLFNVEEGLWYRDRDFVPPYEEPNGQHCYWSRGCGWVYAALVRTMEAQMVGSLSIPPRYYDNLTETQWKTIPVACHFEDYKSDYLKMTEAFLKCQRKDLFWNVSLLDESNFGGKELTGTALFVYGMAWGVRHQMLPRERFIPIIAKTWKAMVKECLHKSGKLGYVQGTGKQPSDSQPVTYDSEPDFDDFGLGCFLLAGTEVYRLAIQEVNLSIRYE